MNKLVKFENTSIDVQIINGIPMFELYAVGMALGQIKKNGAGTSYPRKDRIEENVKSTEIKPCVRNGHSYITESQIYDLMLETKTDKCRAFRKWLTNEVLPELNKTGSYSVAKPDKQLELYNYVEKTYRGKTVLTVADVTFFTGLDNYRIFKVLKSVGSSPNDFILLKGADLDAFKSENRMNSSFIKQLTVINETGFGLICGYYNINVDKIKAFHNKIDDSNRVKRPNESVKSLMEYVSREANAIIGLTYLLNTMDTKENLEFYRKNLSKRIKNLRGYVIDIETIKI